MKYQYSVGSLFAGIGGVCLAFNQAGSKLLWANEFDKFACQTYKANFKEHTLFEGDVRQLDTRDVLSLGKTDILTAGFPCQPFSKAGLLLGFQDPRGNLFYEIVRFINELRPQAILLENVQNLKLHDNKNTFKTIEQEIRKAGYSFYAEVLNTHTHSTVPQNRERVFIVGFRDDIKDKIEFKFPDKIQKENLRSMRCFVDRSKKADSRYYYTAESQYYPMFISRIANYESIYHLRRVYVREILNGLCPTLTANMGLGGHNVPLIKDKWGIRKLTPRECANFQGFPKRFVLPINVSHQQLYKQLGNSVTVPLVKRIAGNIISSLNTLDRPKVYSRNRGYREAELAFA